MIIFYSCKKDKSSNSSNSSPNSNSTSLNFEDKIKQAFADTTTNHCNLDSFKLFSPNTFFPNTFLNNLFYCCYACCSSKYPNNKSCLKSFNMTIKIDGQTIINTNDPTFGWDGKINGKDAPEYVYDIEIYVLLTSGKSCTYKGFVILVRDNRKLCGYWDKCTFGDQISPCYGFIYATQERPPDCKK